MKLVDNLIRKTAERFNITELEAHQVIMSQFEYVTKATKTEDILIEISGIGYLKVNYKKLEKDIVRQESLKENLLNILEREDQEEVIRTTNLKLEGLLEDLEINYNKREQIKKDLEKQKRNSPGVNE